MISSFSRYIVAAVTITIAATQIARSQPKRPVTPDDLMSIEEIGDVAISPDGRSVAYVIRRSPLSQLAHPPNLEIVNTRNDRGDVWLAPVEGGAPTNLTHGLEDGSGYWMPTWSPNGSRLAMLSTKGGDKVRLWVWEKATGKLSRVSENQIALRSRSFAWVDDERLLALIQPDGDRQDPTYVRYGAGYYTSSIPDAWQKMRNGREPAATVLDSGVSVDVSKLPQVQLTLLSTRGGEQLLGSSAEWREHERLFPEIAPDMRHFAFPKQVALRALNPGERFDENTRLGYAGYRYQIDIVDESGKSAIRPDKEIQPLFALDSFRWSRDGRAFAFIGVQNGDDEDGPYHVYRGSIGGAIEIVSLPDTNPKALVWAENGKLLVLADPKVTNAGAKSKRADWWLIKPAESPRNVTENLKLVPDSLLPDPTWQTFVGIAGGDVWRLEISSGEWKNLTSSFYPNIKAIRWPSSNPIDKSALYIGFGSIVVSARGGSTPRQYKINIASGVVTPIAQRSEFARFSTYSPQKDLAVFRSEEPTGTYLAISRNMECATLASIDTFIGQVAEGELRQIDYTSLDGDQLKAWLILPPNYQKGKRYPLVTDVYAGSTASDVPRFDMRVNSDLGSAAVEVMLQLFAARGYVVLIPSMPLKPWGETSDPYMELTKGVLPAVDKAIEVGYADPQRLAVRGHSYGGYSTYGLITQTNRFRAAIASAGPSNLISAYGEMFPPWKYDAFPGNYLSLGSLEESGQGRMGNPPWKDLGRYIRNSPISYVDRVHTPLMIVQGDLDVVPIGQGEEFFTSLNRQGKRVRFIRYWGEGHVLESPANIRDFWMRAYAWFDEFLDISRDDKGDLVFDGERVKSRKGAPPLKLEDFTRFEQMELKSHPWVHQKSEARDQKSGVRNQ